MTVEEYQILQAEHTELKQILNNIPEEDIIDRISFQFRLDEVNQMLTIAPSAAPIPLRVRLTFRGRPIVGSHGVFAEFGASAVNAFAGAVAAIGASMSGPLGSRGTIPNREDFQLLITGTAPGSFGFDLEAAPRQKESSSEEPSPVEAALEQAITILEGTIRTDEDLADALSETDPRAIDALRAFLKTMADHDASCALQFQNQDFQFADSLQVRQSMNRLNQENIHEEKKTLDGVFLGVLPKKRTFEFQVAETGEIISGRVGKELIDAASINTILNQSTTIDVHTTTVGHGRPRYVLTRCADLPILEEPTSKDNEG